MVLDIYFSENQVCMNVVIYYGSKLLPSARCRDWTKVRKKAEIRNGYNQIPHLILDTIWESDKIQEIITRMRAKRSVLSKQVTTKPQGTDKTLWQSSVCYDLLCDRRLTAHI